MNDITNSLLVHTNDKDDPLYTAGIVVHDSSMVIIPNNNTKILWKFDQKVAPTFPLAAIIAKPYPTFSVFLNIHFSV